NSREIQEMRRVNVEGTCNLYSAAAVAGCRFFLHMSSSGVYGPPHAACSFREDDACNPVTPYQITKFEAEKALAQIEPKETTLNILRPSGVYGPGSFLELGTYKKIRAQKWALELSGGVVVHPIHVQDVVAAIIAVVERPAPHGTVFNLGGER